MIGQTGFGHKVAEEAVRQRAPTDVAQADEHHPDFVGRSRPRCHKKPNRFRTIEACFGVYVLGCFGLLRQSLRSCLKI